MARASEERATNGGDRYADARRFGPRRRRVLAAFLCALAFGVPRAQEGTIEDIQVQGLRRMSPEAFLHALGIQRGDPYDVARVRQRFRSLWALGLFRDITFETERGHGGGTVLVVKVEERPVLTSVTYEENPVLTRTAIEDRLRERQLTLQLGKPIDMGAVFFAQTAIRDLLAEKGHLNSEVKVDVQNVTETTRAVHFGIVPGGKTRIRSIEFVGNTVFSDGHLKRELKLTQERQWYWPWSGKNLYHPVKWDQDAGGLRDLYQSRGYLDVEVRAPVVTVEDPSTKKKKEKEKEGAPPAPTAATTALPAPSPTPLPTPMPAPSPTPAPDSKAAKKAAKAEKKANKEKHWVTLQVPIVEGQPYTLGQVKITGASVIPETMVRQAIPMHEGDVLNNGKLEAAVDAITKAYENRGHLYAQVVRRIERRPGENVADVAIDIDEDKPYYVSRIDFTGNTATRDAVLRREVLLSEGDLFNRTALDLSKAKINQLGYYQVAGEPIVEPVEGESQVHVKFAGEEQGRNEIQIGGGYSGVDGAFFNGVYSTRNFLGRGQIVSVALQIGGRSNRFQISFQEPWFLNRPYRFGASVFRQDVDYGSTLSSTSSGMGLVLGKRLRRFGSIDLSYRFQDVTSESVLVGGATPTRLVTTTQVSSLTPVYTFTTINNPYRPTRGRSLTASLQIAGGPLGGDTSFLKPIVVFTGYRHSFGHSMFALHAQVGAVREWQGGSPLTGSNIEGVPRFERFWLGGETLGPRVFETRSITPVRYVELKDGVIVDVLGDPRFVSVSDLVTSGGIPVPVEIGGDRYYLVQLEHVFPMNEQVEIAAFLDAGDALAEDQSINFDTIRASAGIELRFHLPIFPVPLRLIYGVPVRELDTDRTSNFTFSIGRSF
jgi:outer membrane protein insertion porin family